METMQQIHNEYRKVVFKTFYTNKTVEDQNGNQQTVKVRGHVRVSDLSLKEFARQHGVLEVVRAAHKAARKSRSEAVAARTRAGIIAKKQKKQKVQKTEVA